jgi:hypothetical protein
MQEERTEKKKLQEAHGKRKEIYKSQVGIIVFSEDKWGFMSYPM